MSENGTILELKGVTKVFPGVTALNKVDFAVRHGEVHVLVGENGAGKSTLVKIIIGGYVPEHIETMRLDGKEVTFSNPKDAIRHGIAAVHQHFTLAPDMSVAENIFMGREMVKGIGLDDRRMIQRASQLIEQLGVSLNPRTDVRSLPPGDRQVVEICKALSSEPRILLMDEPTSGLNQEEITRLFAIIRNLKERGVSILYITHRLEEAFDIGDAVTVLRNGERVFTGPMPEVTHEKLSQLIVGREIKNRYPKEEIPIGDTVLRVRALENTRSEVPLHDISFEVRGGEIVGIYGILGSGKDGLARTLAGVEPPTAGEVAIDGAPVKLVNPRNAIKSRLGYLTDDRHGNGLVLVMTVKQNQTLVALKEFSTLNHIRRKPEQEASDRMIRELSIRTPSREFVVNNLSGGNQQKVVFSKWIISHSRVLMLHEPTRGIDVGSKVEVFRAMLGQAREGRAILFISSELEEVAEMSDRILVMRAGRIVAEYRRHEVPHDQILRIATRKQSGENTGKGTQAQGGQHGSD